MKPEPLKDKSIMQNHITHTKDQIYCRIYWEKDIKSAVEWLKNEFINYLHNKYFEHDNYSREDDEKMFLKIIDKAFEDVMEKRRRENEI